MGVMSVKNLHDIWYLAVETTIDGERRGFSRQIKARPDRLNKIPVAVHGTCQEFLASVVDLSDVRDYSTVASGDRFDYPYRFANYVLSCNGSEVVRSFAVRPLKPAVAS